MRRRLTFALLMACLVAPTVKAQGAGFACTQSLPDDDVQDGPGINGPDSLLLRGAEALARRIAGRYHMVMVITSGAGIGKHASEGDAIVRLAGVAPPQGMRTASLPIFEIDFAIKRSGFLHEPLERHQPARHMMLHAMYTGTIHLDFGEADPADPGDWAVIDDAAWGYSVTRINDAAKTISGAVTGGSVWLQTVTPVGTLVEPVAGYFCMQRVSN